MASRSNPISPPRKAFSTPDAVPDRLTVASGSAPQQSLPLEHEETPVHPRRRREQLWLCIRLPWLSLEALGESPLSTRPLAVMEEEGGRLLVHLAGREAVAAGIRCGQTLSAALALEPDLDTLSRRPSRERAALEFLAEWAMRFSPLTSLEPPDSLLLEVRGSLRLFHGLGRLCERVAGGLRRQGYRARLSAAPTPLASLWLARTGDVRVETVEDLPRHLNSLDLRVTGWPDALLRALDGIGVTTIGECRRLPREGFARRFGMDRLQTLDRAFGFLPDPRLRHSGSPSFRERLDLDEESLDEALLMEGAVRLLSALEDFLLRHQRAARRLCFRFFHLHGEATPLTLDFSEAGSDTKHWRGLLGIRLERLRLSAPVIAIELATGRLEPWQGETPVLPSIAGRRDGVGPPRLVESLRARLGEDAVRGLRTLAEHRPQQAWDAVDPLAGKACAELSPWGRLDAVLEGIGELPGGSLLLERPLWVLKEPQRLAVHEGRPCHDGPLRIVNGPERIESGWWDGTDTARDYYVAETGAGVRLWVYQDRRRPAGWYLQGVFG